MIHQLEVALGKNVREIRTDLGLTQPQFGARLGRKRGYVSKIETGHNMSLRKLMELASKLDVDPVDLLRE